MRLDSLLPRLALGLAAAVACLAAFAGTALANSAQESIMQDDRLLQNYGIGAQTDTLVQMKLLGVDTVHAVINWGTLAPSPNDGSVPAGLDLTDPASYNAERWLVIDSLVRSASFLGIDLILSPAAPGPAWANGKDCTTSEKRRATAKGTCRTDAKLYGQFVSALAERYNGEYVPDAQPEQGPLPKVTRWSLWNEANLNSWLYPSQVTIRGKRVPISAKIYRDLVYAGGEALLSNGHAGDQILLGETGPLGQGSARTAPVDFYRALFCIGANGKRLTGSAAKRLGCPRQMERLPVNGVAHHPYTKGAAQELMAKQHSNDITISNVAALRRVLTQGARARAISSGTASHVYFTEFGVSSTPPAKPRSYGVPLSRQAEYINQFEYISYLNPAVRAVAQFQLEDDKFAASSTGGKLTFQTGLRFAATDAQIAAGEASEAKPSLAAYVMPLFVHDKGKKLVIWGGVRSVDSGRVKILNNGRTVKTVSLRRGYFITSIKKRKGTWQLAFGDSKSRIAKPVKMKQPAAR